MKHFIRLITCSVCAFTATTVIAQEDASQGYIEEIIVTSKAHPDGINVQDHAVAVSVLTGDYLNESGIKDMFDLQQNAPGLLVGHSQNSTTSNFLIRGVGTSSNNFGLESSVGLYVDGVYRARQSSMINNLVDIEMVQVLRGPQGTLFGKNTPQGAISMRTVKPDHDPNAFVDLTAGDYGLVNLSAATNFSLSETVAMRATLFSGQRDGYVSDITLGNDVINDRDRIGGRLQLYYTPNDRFNMRIIADYAEINEVCCAALTRFDSIVANDRMSANPDPLAALMEDAGSDFVLLNLGATIFADSPITDPFRAAVIGGLPGTVIDARPDDYMVALNRLPHSSNEDLGLSVEFHYDFENTTLTSISAFRSFDSLDIIDADFSDFDMITKENAAEQSSFSQELRLAGQIGDAGSYVVGGYFFSQDLDNSSSLTSGPLIGVYADLVTDLDLLKAGIDQVAALTGGLLPASGIAAPPFTFADEVMMQEHESWAIFSQAEFELGDQLLLTAGIRYTDEEKTMIGTHVQSAQGPFADVQAMQIILCQADPTCPLNPVLPPFNPFDPATQATFDAFSFDGWGTYALSDAFAPRPDINTKLEDDQVTYTVKLSWFPNDSTMVYASYGTGYKSGGTNTDRINVNQSTIFGPETSESIEVGIKADLTDHLRVNLAIYDNQIEDVQALSFTGTGFNVQNAGSEDTNGVELELWWVPVDSFAMQFNYVRSIADYEVFVLGTCWDAFPFHPGMPDPGPAGPLGTCDRSGDRAAYNPENQYFVAATKDFRVGSSTTLFIRGEYTYTSDLLTDGDADPLGLSDSLEILNLRLGLIFENMDAELTLWGRNVTDEAFFASTFDAPLQDGKLNYYAQEPATWGVTFRKNF